MTPAPDREPRSLEQAKIDALSDALTDMLSGWSYIRTFHGDLYGIAWKRAQEKAEAALAFAAEQPTRREK